MAAGVAGAMQGSGQTLRGQELRVVERCGLGRDPGAA
jgi:hypothetical protein